MEEDERYLGIKSLANYLDALVSIPNLPSPVFRSRMNPVSNNEGLQYSYSIDLTRFDPESRDLPVFPIRETNNQQLDSVTVSKINHLNDRVISHPIGERLRAVA